MHIKEYLQLLNEVLKIRKIQNHEDILNPLKALLYSPDSIFFYCFILLVFFSFSVYIFSLMMFNKI